MIRPVFGPINNSTNSATVTRLIPLDGGTGALVQAIGVTNGQPVAAPGVISNLTVTLAAAPAGVASYQYTLLVNSVASALTVTLTGTDTQKTSTAQVTVAAGDLVDIQQVPTGTPTVTTYYLSSSFTGTNAGETVLMGNAGASGTPGPFWNINGGTARTTDADAQTVAPTAFTLDHLYYTTGNTIGAGNTTTLTLYKNGSPTTLTSTNNNSSLNSPPDLTHSVSFVAGDTLSIAYTSTGSPTARLQLWGMRLTPVIDGEFPIMASAPLGISSGANRFNPVQGVTGNNTTEASVQAVAPIAFTLKKGNWSVIPTPQAGHQWLFNSRINAVDGTITGTITTGNTNVVDNTHSDSINALDVIDWRVFGTSGSTVLTYNNFSGVAFIAPPATTIPDLRLFFL